MINQHYTITTDVARVYKVRGCPRYGWGWAVATIREWPKGGQLDVQSDFGTFAYSWNAIGDRTLRQFLCGLDFDYFMNKAAAKGYRVFDEEKSRRAIKKEIFDYLKCRCIDRETAHEWRDDLDGIEDCGSEHLFAERLMQHDWVWRLYDSYPDLVMMDDPRCRAFWDGPWKALREHWRAETAAATPVAAGLTQGELSR